MNVVENGSLVIKLMWHIEKIHKETVSGIFATILMKYEKYYIYGWYSMHTSILLVLQLSSMLIQDFINKLISSLVISKKGIGLYNTESLVDLENIEHRYEYTDS